MRWRPQSIAALERLKAHVYAQTPTKSLFEVEEPLNFWAERLMISRGTFLKAIAAGMPSRRTHKHVLISLGHVEQFSRNENYSIVLKSDEGPKELVDALRGFPQRFLGPAHAEHQRYWWSPTYLRPWVSEAIWRVIANPESGGAPGHSCRAWNFWHRDLQGRGLLNLLPTIKDMAARGEIRTWLVSINGTKQAHPVDRDVWRFLYEQKALGEARAAYLDEVRTLSDIGMPIPTDTFGSLARTPPLLEVLIDEQEGQRKAAYLESTGGRLPPDVFDGLYKQIFRGTDVEGRIEGDQIVRDKDALTRMRRDVLI